MPARLTLSAPQRAALATDINVYVRILVRRADGTWIDLSSYFGTDWFVKGELRATIDDPVWNATLTLLREDGGGISLAPQISASAANRDGGGAYSPLVATGNQIRVLTATVPQGAAPASGDWKRMFDGRIDSTDPGGDDGVMVVTARDRGAYLLDTFIETKRTYADPDTAAETVMAQIIADNAVPGSPTIDTPTSPGWILTKYEQDLVPVMQALRDLALQIGWDFRYFFLADGDVDPTLVFYQPPRTATTPDWIFAPNEYLEIPNAKLDDADVRNAVEIFYRDSGGLRQSVVRVNASSITQFGRRYMQVTEADASNIDTSAEATAMGDALVADMGEPVFTHQMRTLYFWPVNINDICQFTANGVHYDQAQALAVVGITHTFGDAPGHGETVLDCRGQPAGAFHEWLALAGTPAGGGQLLIITTELVSQDSTTYTVKVSASAPGSTRQPAVEILWTGINPPVSRLAGASPATFVPNGSTWTFTKTTPGSGPGACGFMATLSGYADTMFQVVIPEGVAVGPSIGTPTVTPQPDPTNDVVVGWAAGSEPAGAKYRVYWRLDVGLTWHMVDYTTVGSAHTYTVPHGSDFFHIIDPGTSGTARTFQAYVEMYDSSGVFIVQSAIGEATWYDDGLG